MKPKLQASRLVLPYPILRRARRLLDQQLWCLGCDVRQADFPLAELGMHFLRRPQRDRGCSRLTATLPQGGHLSLWGFGIVAHRPGVGAIWLRRQGFRPLFHRGFDPRIPCWEHRDFNTWRAPANEEETRSALLLLRRLSEGFAAYEAEVARRFGGGYRARCVAAWPHRLRALPPEGMADDWRILAEAFATLPSTLKESKKDRSAETPVRISSSAGIEADRSLHELTILNRHILRI